MPRARPVLALTLMLLLAAHFWLAAREGLSNLFAHMAELEINQSTALAPAPREAAAARARQYLETSLRHSPGNAWALEQMGVQQISLARQLTQPMDGFNALNARHGALSHFRLALRERPASPFVWANLAVAKLQLGQADAEMLQALRWADELGPWEPEIQNIVISGGLAAWAWMDAAQRDSLLRTMVRGAQRDPAKIVNIGKSFNRFDLLCAINYTRLAVESACGPGKQTRRPKP